MYILYKYINERRFYYSVSKYMYILILENLYIYYIFVTELEIEVSEAENEIFQYMGKLVLE